MRTFHNPLSFFFIFSFFHWKKKKKKKERKEKKTVFPIAFRQIVFAISKTILLR